MSRQNDWDRLSWARGRETCLRCGEEYHRSGTLLCACARRVDDQVELPERELVAPTRVRVRGAR